MHDIPADAGVRSWVHDFGSVLVLDDFGKDFVPQLQVGHLVPDVIPADILVVEVVLELEGGREGGGGGIS